MNRREPDEILNALQYLALHHPVLRTTLIANKTSFLQVIRKTADLSWDNLDMNVGEFASQAKRTVELGGNFVHFTILQNNILAVTVHHALLDYWSNSFLIDDVVATVRGQPLVTRPSFANSIQYIQQQNHSELQNFWQEKLRGVTPFLLGGRGEENVVVRVELKDDLQAFASAHKVSLGSLIYAAWAIAVSVQTMKNEIVFGTTLSGRDVPVPGILHISGPTITTVPFRAQVNPELVIIDLRQSRKKWQTAALYDTIINVLIMEEESSLRSNHDILEPWPPYEPNYLDHTMLEAESTPGGMELRLLSSLPRTKVSLILGHVVETLRAALKSPMAKVAEINFTSLEDVSQSLEQPAQLYMFAHSLVDRMVARYPDK